MIIASRYNNLCPKNLIHRKADIRSLQINRNGVSFSTRSNSVPIDDSIYGFTEDQKILRAATAKFVDAHVLPHRYDIENSGKFDYFPKMWKTLGSAGLLGITVPEKYGGLGLSYLDHIIVLEEIARASGSVGISAGAHSNLCANQISRMGSDEQKLKYLPKLCTGDHVGALAMSEATSGSDVMSMKLTAVEDGNNYVLNGTKMWITNGPIADTLIVYAKTDPDAKPSKQLTTFVIEKGMAGFSTGDPLIKIGLRGSPTGELIFQDCVVPKENVLGRRGSGAMVLMSGLDLERIVLCALGLGTMQAAVDVTIPYVTSRKQFGKPVASFQMIQSHMADMYTALQSSRCYTYAVARASCTSTASQLNAASVFMMVAKNAVAVSQLAIRCLGANGYMEDYPAGRFLNDAMLGYVGGGSYEMRKMLIARHFLEMYKE